MEKVRIGFIGCGGIANAHMERLSKIGEVEFACMCDIVEEKAKMASKKYGGKVYTDYKKMLDEVEIDACYICLPPFAHENQEFLCIQKNIPFFIEKPVHLDLERAKEIAEKVEEKNLITSVGYLLRYFDIIEKAREILKDKEIGLVRGKYFGGIPGGGKTWHSKKNQSGGQLIEQATHIVDLMRYMVGEIEEVYACRFEGINKKLYPEYDVEDASVTCMRFKNGTIGNLTCTWLLYGYSSDIEIVGKEILIRWERNTLTVEYPDKKITYISKMDPMLEEDRAFINALKNRDPSYIKCDYTEGFKTLKVTILARRSFEEGIPFKVDV